MSQGSVNVSVVISVSIEVDVVKESVSFIDDKVSETIKGDQVKAVFRMFENVVIKTTRSNNKNVHAGFDHFIGSLDVLWSAGDANLDGGFLWAESHNLLGDLTTGKVVVGKNDGGWSGGANFLSSKLLTNVKNAVDNAQHDGQSLSGASWRAQQKGTIGRIVILSEIEKMEHNDYQKSLKYEWNPI